MLKKVIIVIFIFIPILSCGKKSDPIFKENGKNFESTELKVLL